MTRKQSKRRCNTCDRSIAHSQWNRHIKSQGHRENLYRNRKRRRRERRGKPRTIPVTTSNPTIKVSSAEYDPSVNKTNIAIVDEDDDGITFIMQEIPFKVDEISVDEQGNIGLVIDAKGTKEIVTAIVETPKDV